MKCNRTDKWRRFWSRQPSKVLQCSDTVGFSSHQGTCWRNLTPPVRSQWFLVQRPSRPNSE